MARRDEKKAMLPTTTDKPWWFIQCSANPACRKTGRMFVEGMDPGDRICIDHYYAAVERGARDAEPPKRRHVAIAKPVAGD